MKVEPKWQVAGRAGAARGRCVESNRPSGGRALVPPGLIKDLQQIVGPGGVLHRPEALLVFEYDAYLETATPTVAVQPESTAAVQAIVALAGRHQLAVVPRGAA